jgi:methionine synthase II (cobalamin-independent)
MDLISERGRRVVATHVGSLPRPSSLSTQLLARMTGRDYDREALSDELHRAVIAIVAKQAALGIDVVSDGEFSKTSFQYYVTDRLSGIEPITPAAGARATRENRAFPTFYKNGSHAGTQATRYACTGPIEYVGRSQLAADIENLKAGLAGVAHVDAFMPSVSPSSCVGLMENRYYKNDEEHLFAVAEALRQEYLAIIEAGLMLQIDDPRLAMHYMLSPDQTVDQTRAWAQRRIEALNHALRDIPPERVRHQRRTARAQSDLGAACPHRGQNLHAQRRRRTDACEEGPGATQPCAISISRSDGPNPPALGALGAGDAAGSPDAGRRTFRTRQGSGAAASQPRSGGGAADFRAM